MTTRLPFLEKDLFNVYVDLKYLTSDQQGVDKCVAIGLCLYDGEAPTLTVVTSDGALYDHIPLFATGEAKHDCNAYLKNISKGEYEYCIYPYLKNKPVSAKGSDGSWEYLMTVDCIDGNDSFNILKNNNGCLIARANYQMFFAEKPTKRKYKKVEDIVLCTSN